VTEERRREVPQRAHALRVGIRGFFNSLPSADGVFDFRHDALIIDAAFYLISCLAERWRNVTILRSVQEATDPTHAQRIIADALPELVANALQSADFERMREHLRRLPAPTD
jgi:hypothetical protein